MAFCPNCGNSHEEGAKFCAICGNSLAAPQNPAPQYQAPQYQPPQNPAPQYQPNPYQASPYQPNPYQPNPYQPVPQAPMAAAGNRTGAKKTATTALVFCGVAVALYILGMIASRIAYNSLSATVSTPISVYVTQVIKFGICALFPFLAVRAASTGNIQSAKGISTASTIYLVVQLVMALLMFVAMAIMRYMGMNSNLYIGISSIASYIAGSNVLSLLLNLNFRSPFFVSNLFSFLSAASCIVVTILTLSSAGKLKKS